jgi:hypothetical protein
MAFHEGQPVLTKTGRRGRPPRRVGHNLLLRLSSRKQDVLRFLTDPSVPFTTNLAERDGRMMKLRQKISGGFRSEASAIQQRKGFIKLLDKLDEDDVLIVTKMDRLGRNAIDVKATIDELTSMHVRVHCLQWAVPT